MTVTTTNLDFTTTEPQSLWGPGTPIDLSIDTGDLLIWDPAESTKLLDLDAKVASLSGTAYVDVKFGLVASASLGSTGGFEAGFDLTVNVEHDAAVLTTAPGAAMRFDFSDYTLGAANLSSEGFDISPSASLELVIDVSAGIRDVKYKLPFARERSADDISLVDIDETITLFELSPFSVEFEFELTEGVTLTGRLPTGADTEGGSFGETIVSASGSSDTAFLEIAADLDALLVELIKQVPVPPAAGVAKVLENTVFADYEFDLSDYIPLLSEDWFTLEAKILDIGASAGAVLTEDLSLDIGNGDDTPDVNIVLRSDNGTPDDFSDDVVGTGVLGGQINLAAPTVGGFGTALVTAYFDLAGARYAHDVGIGLNAAFTISALQATVGGSLGEKLGISLGPLLEVEFPEGGLNVDLFDFYSDEFDIKGGAFTNPSSGTNPNSWGYQGGAFGQQTATYEVFYSSFAPEGWNKDAPGALSELFAFIEADQKNNTEVLASLSELLAGKKAPIFLHLLNPTTYSSTTDTNQPVLWNGTVTSLNVNLPENAGNVLVVAPLQQAGVTTGLGAVVDAAFGGGSVLQSFSLSGDQTGNIATVAELIGTAAFTRVNYVYGLNRFSTRDSVNVVGTEFRDIMLYVGDEASYFDGGRALTGSGTGRLDGDTFIANFAASHPDSAIVWDLDEASFGRVARLDVLNQEGQAHSITLKDIENIALVTGDHDDFLVTGSGFDFLSTKGGNDFIRNFGDIYSEQARLGSGDDVIALEFRAVNPLPSLASTDQIYGETGSDAAIVSGQGFSALRWNLIGTFDDFVGGKMVSGTTGVGAAAGIFTLATVRNEMMALLDPDDPARLDRSGLVGGVEGFRFVRVMYGSETGGSYDISVDVESISLIGSDEQNDLAFFTGGVMYDGGVSGLDTFVADFSAYETVTVLIDEAGVSKTVADLGLGVALSADQAYLATDGTVFGSSFVGGFERLIVRGTSFNDYLVGGAFNDFLEGGNGNDTLVGRGGNNTLHGGAGDDWFFYEHGQNDQVDGEAPDLTDDGATDWLVVRPGDAARGAADFGGLRYGFFDAAGNLLGEFTAEADTNQLNVAQNLAANAASRYISYSQSLASRVHFTGIERTNVTGSNAFDDLLMYEGGASYIGGERAGDRDVFAADFRGQLIGVTLVINDDETAGYTLENGVFIAGVDRASIHFGEGNDIARGGSLDDSFEGGGGADALSGGGGDDFLRGDAGDDLFYWSGLDGAFDVYEGGDGTDRLIISAQADDGTLLADGGMAVFFRNILPNGDRSDLIPGFIGVGAAVARIDEAVRQVVEAEEFTNFAGSQTVRSDGMEFTEIQGSDAFDDFVLYQHGLYYAGGERAGDRDIFAGNFRSETVDLSFRTTDAADPASPEQAFFDIGTGTWIGQFEAFHLFLGAGDDRAFGGDGTDVLRGGDGDDTLSGGLGRDILSGEGGDDTLLYVGGQATVSGGTGIDVLEVAAQPARMALVLTGGDGLRIDGTSDLASLRSSFQTLFASQLAATTAVTLQHAGGFVRYGTLEKISATGGDRADVFLAGNRGGQLSGGGGADVLISQAGNDLLVGGAGADHYVFGGAFGVDTVAGESVGPNALHFVGHTFAALTFSADGDDLGIAVASGGRVTVVDYFSGGANGLDFEFFTDDFAGTLDLSGLGAVVSAAKLTGAQVRGTASRDLLDTGTDDSDLFDGSAGDDFLVGTPGADLMNGSLGIDAVVYSRSRAGVVVDLDLAFGRGGDAEGDIYLGIEDALGSNFADRLFGNEDDNALAGGGRNDRVAGRGGDDFLGGGSGNDLLLGGTGDDALYGEAGNDTLSGNAGDDYLAGGAGDDELDGGDGDDTLTGGAGSNTSSGGAGNDTLIYQGGIDTFVGGEGSDTVDLSQADRALSINLATGTVVTRPGVPGTGPSGTIVTFSAVERAVGSIFGDRLIGDAAANALAGGSGNDVFTGGQGADAILGGAGSDTLDYGAERTGTRGIEVDRTAARVVDGFGDIDTIDSIEVFLGTRRADVFTGDGTEGTFVGGAGVDHFIGGTGFETIDYSRETGTQGIVADLSPSAQSIIDTFGREDRARGIERIIGTRFDDAMAGDPTLDNTFVGGAGNDTFTGDVGSSDTVDYGHESGGAGVIANLGKRTATDTFGDTDTLELVRQLNGTRLDDQLVGDDASNVLRAQGGDDFLNGDLGGDELYGGDGNDTLNGGRGNGFDRIFGEAGDDLVIAGFGNDQMDGGTGHDTVDLTFFSGRYEIDLRTGETNFDTRVFNFEDVLLGAGNDEVRGNAADNRIVLGSGNDFVFGDLGADRLVGGEGDDTLDGGLGADQLVGGGGGDFFVMTAVDGARDTVVDFEDGLDRVSLAGLSLTFSDLALTDDGEGAVIVTTVGSVLLAGVALAAINEADFVF